MYRSRFTSSQPYRIMIDVRIKMRDGVELSADVYLPPDAGRFQHCSCVRSTTTRAKAI